MTAEAASVLALVLVLAVAIARPRKLPEAAVALPAAALLVGFGAVPWHDAAQQLRDLLPVVGFLAAVLALAELCDDDGLFAALGDALANSYRGRPVRVLTGVFVAASVITAVLSLDATVVLLTPVVFATAARAGARPRPHVYACNHLANTASLLLPVSNLTNLLALSATGLSFVKFAGLMSLPWLVAIVVEYLVFRRFFRSDLGIHETPRRARAATPLPVVTVVVLVLTLVGFVVTSLLGVNPAWAAFGGAAVLAVRGLVRRRTTPLRLVRSVNPLFCAFVLALGVIVASVVDNGLGDLLRHLVPSGASLPALLAIAFLAALLANVINNLPAVLALLPVVVVGGTGPALAVLIGVNVGPNLTYVGSLATLLWRRIVHEHDANPGLAQFTKLGLITVPASLIGATVALWATLQVLGG